MGRQRPAGPIVVSSPEDQEAAQAATTAALDEVTRAVSAAVLHLNAITHPIERAKAVRAVRATLTGPTAAPLDEMYRAALQEAYAVGRSQSGWTGYGALAIAVGVSRAQVQQVINGSWKRGQKDTQLPQELRTQGDLVRNVRRAAEAGESPAAIAERFNISQAQANDLLGGEETHP